MKENKLQTITNLFEGKEIRSIWDNEKEELDLGQVFRHIFMDKLLIRI